MKKSFVLYMDQYGPVKKLSLVQKGCLFDAIFNYHLDKEVECIDDVVAMAFEFFKQTFDRDNNKYLNKCEKNRENGRKGGKQKQANATDRKQPQTKVADSDSDSDSGSDSGSDNEKDLKDYSPEIKNFVDSYQEYVSDNFNNLAPERTKSFLTKCYDTIDKLTRLDGFTFQEVYDCIQWGSQDDFWAKQIRSLSNIRAKGKNGDTKFVNMMSSFKENKNPKLNAAEQRLKRNLEVSKEWLSEQE